MVNVDEALTRVASEVVADGLASELLALAPLFDALALVPATTPHVLDDLRARLRDALGDAAAHALTDGADVVEVVRRGERLLAMVAALASVS